jgi:hypothetical protein
MVMLDRLIAGISGMARNLRVLSQRPRISTGPGRGAGDSEGGGREAGGGSIGSIENLDFGTISELGSPDGKSGIGASMGAPGMGLRVMAMARGGRSASVYPER